MLGSEIFSAPNSGSPQGGLGRTAALVAGALAVVFLASCASLSEKVSARLEASPEQKQESFRPYEDQEIGGEKVKEFLRHRMADVVCGDDVLRVVFTEDNKRVVMLEPSAKAPAVSSASAVTKDGYFLTAGHSVSAKQPTWVISKSMANPYFARARVVWKSDKQDLALIKADVKTKRYFRIASGMPVRDDDVVLGGHIGESSAGHVLNLRTAHEGSERYHLIHHDSPLRRGDSGGPLIRPDGRLVGINVGLVGAFIQARFEYGWSVRVDGEKVRGLIAKDRRK